MVHAKENKTAQQGSAAKERTLGSGTADPLQTCHTKVPLSILNSSHKGSRACGR